MKKVATVTKVWKDVYRHSWTISYNHSFIRHSYHNKTNIFNFLKELSKRPSHASKSNNYPSEIRTEETTSAIENDSWNLSCKVYQKRENFCQKSCAIYNIIIHCMLNKKSFVTATIVAVLLVFLNTSLWPESWLNILHYPDFKCNHIL